MLFFAFRVLVGCFPDFRSFVSFGTCCFLWLLKFLVIVWHLFWSGSSMFSFLYSSFFLFFFFYLIWH